MSTYGDDPLQPQNASQPPLGESVSFGAPAPSEPPPPASRGRKVAIGVGAGAVVLALAGGAAVWAVSSFLSGGGDQPESVVPASAVAYADVDLDPSAGQKVAAYRFLRKFPAADTSSSEGDLMGQVVKTFLKADPSASIEYERDIEPWLGKRAAVAAVPSGDGLEPDTLVVVQVTDEQKAKTSLRKLLDENTESGFGSDGSYGQPARGLVVRDGFALIGPDQASTEEMSDAAESADLGSSKNFSADMDTIGDAGVASMWADLDAGQKLGSVDAYATGLSGLGGAGTGGRVVAAVRFESDAVELAARQLGAGTAKPSDKPGGPLLQSLPADTTGALAVGNASDAVKQIVDDFIADQQKKASGVDVKGEVEALTGLSIPADLQTLVGSGVAVAVGDLTGTTPQVAVRVRTDDAAGSRRALDTVLAAAEEQGAGFVEVPDIADALSADGIVYAATPTYAELVAGAGTLGKNADFVAAVPDAATANTAGYVNFGRVALQVPDVEVKKNLAMLRALGFTARTNGTDSEITVRLVAE